jgi:threonine dehydrogenase-like Zn-dependent dehydrogenase
VRNWRWERISADQVINVDEQDTVDRITGITGGAGADVVLELAPMAYQPVGDALRAVRHGGRVVIAGLKGDHPSRSTSTC